MTKKLNIALLTDILPDKQFTAGQVLDLIVQNTDDALFDIYWINQSHLPEAETLPSNAATVQTVYFKGVSSPVIRQVVGSTARKLHLRGLVSQGLRICCPAGSFRRRVSVNLYRKLQGMGRGAVGCAYSAVKATYVGLKLGLTLRSKNYDVVWLVLQGDKLAITYYALSFISNKKIILQQWDPIGWWAQNRAYGAWLARVLERIVYKLEQKAYLNLVPSQAWMQEQTEQGKHSLCIDNFFSKKILEQKPFLKLSNPEHLNVVFVGQSYAYTELLQLVNRINHAACALGKKIVVHYFGASPLDLPLKDVTVFNHAYMERDALIERIRKFDLAILPYPMDPKFSQASQYSFPSKSRIYLAAGLPIVSFCALDASPHVFYKKYYQYYYFNMLESKDLKGFIERAASVSQPEVCARMDLATRLINDHFSKRAEFAPLHSILEALKQ